jgi:HlyD family secretion protein
VGSTINPFDMVIATLPDLSSMISKTYVSEIDVSKIKPGQKVNVKIDAYRDKVYSATVINVAKIGEQLPNSDTKMFEVLSRIDESDPRLRPSMTTGNEIIISSFENVVYIPLECVHTESDGIPFVYTKNRTKQVVVLGESNDKYVIVNRGLKSGTAIYLYTPENPDKFKLAGEALIPLISQTLTNR